MTKSGHNHEKGRLSHKGYLPTLTSLSPYGASFWALILAACGGGGGGGPTTSTTQKLAAIIPASPRIPVEPEPEPLPPQVPRSSEVRREGYVYDGPIRGAKVYIDSNANGKLDRDDDHYVGETDSDGAFRGTAPQRFNGMRYIVDLSNAVDTDDDVDLSGYEPWLAPEGATVVSAVTHLIATGVMTREEIEAQLPGFDPLHDNAYGPAYTPEQDEVFAKVRAVLPELTQLVQKNQANIKTNARKIEQNERIIGELKDEIEGLKKEFETLVKNTSTPTNHKPTAIELSHPSYQFDEGEDAAVIGALTRITIADDGLGNVALAALPKNSLFEYRPVAGKHGVYDLYLKSSITLDQSMVGPHNVRIQATGDGTGPNPEAVYFTLTINNIEHDPVITRTNNVTLTLDETSNSAAADTGLKFRVDDADGNVTTSPALNDDRFELRASGQEWALWVKAGKTFQSGEAITLTLTATDATNRSATETISFTIGDIEHDPVLTIIPAPQQTRITETTGDAIGASINTGVIVLARDADNDLRPLIIESRKANGSWVIDNRFEVNGDKLIIKADQQFDYEHADNPNGLINLRITANDNTGNSFQQYTSIQLTNADDPTTNIELAIDGVVNGSAQIGTPLTGKVDASDPDGDLEYFYAWVHEFDKEPLSESKSYTPDRPGKHTLMVMIRDKTFNSYAWVQQDITVPEPINPQPAPAPTVTRLEAKAEFYSTDNGVFETDTNTYLFRISEDVEGYHAIGRVHFGDHPDPDQSSGRTLYTMGGPHRHLLLLAGDGTFRLGKHVDLDAKGLTGLNELHFTVVALFFPDPESTDRLAYSRTFVSRVVIFDPENPDAEIGPPPANPPFIKIDGAQTIITETTGENGTERVLETGIRINVKDANDDLDQIVIENIQSGQRQIDSRFELVGDNLRIKVGSQLDYEDASNPNGLISLCITATDEAGNSFQQYTSIQLTNADDPTTGSVQVRGLTNNSIVANAGALNAITNLHDPDDATLDIVYQWQQQVDGNWQNVEGATGARYTPDMAGIFRLEVTATDTVFRTDTTFHSSSFTVNAPPPLVPPTHAITQAIYENHPLTKPVIDLDGWGVFAMAPTADAPDNQLFRVDAATGKIWFVPVDANGNGRVDAGDYPLLDAEDHRDQGRDGTYDLSLTRTAPDGTVTIIDLALTVQDLPVVNAYGVSLEHPDDISRYAVKMTYGYLSGTEVLKDRIAGLIDDWFRDYRSDLTPQETATQTQYMKYLLYGSAWWTPPDGSTLHLSWSLNTKRLSSQQTIEAARAKVERALAEFEKFLTIDFIEVAHSAESQGMMEIIVAEGWAFPYSTVNGPWGAVSVSLDRHGLEIYFHEIGHNLGLDHPFAYADGPPHTGPPKQGHFARNPDERDDQSAPSRSMMTYHSPRDERVITQNDINALQFLYGIPGTDYHGLYADIEDWFNQPGNDVPFLI